MKINVAEPNGPYECDFDTGAMDVTIREAYLGALFDAGNGIKLAVCMRDDGFELQYFGLEGTDDSFCLTLELKGQRIITKDS